MKDNSKVDGNGTGTDEQQKALEVLVSMPDKKINVRKIIISLQCTLKLHDDCLLNLSVNSRVLVHVLYFYMYVQYGGIIRVTPKKI